jgi:hypothetical protein
MDYYINTLLSIINYVQLSISLCNVDNAYTCAYMLEVLLLLILLMGESTPKCHNFGELESLFKVFF